MNAVEELSPQVGMAAACRSLGVPRATLYRRRPGPGAVQSAVASAPIPRPKPPRSLSEPERQQVLDVLHSEPFADKAPAEVYAALLDRGQYLCSIRTMYRILDDEHEVRERRDQLRHPTYQRPQLVATAPNQVWSWDITKLLGPAKWTYFHLYVILDIFSRYVVGWMLARRESEHLAQRLIRETVVKEGIVRDQLTIHSDRGPSMRSQTVAQLLATLGITKSHSRPHVSDDNPFSESQFKTLKYRPQFPDRFASIEHGLDFCSKFFHWQNHEHHHWGLGLLTPATVHHGLADAVLAARQVVLTAAHTAHPERFVRQPPRPLALPGEVWINPPADGPEPRMLQLPRDTNFVPQLSQNP
jgi:putative transposase